METIRESTPKVRCQSFIAERLIKGMTADSGHQQKSVMSQKFSKQFKCSLGLGFNKRIQVAVKEVGISSESASSSIDMDSKWENLPYQVTQTETQAVSCRVKMVFFFE